jgi:Protein of unknwon function (DUF3310)
MSDSVNHPPHYNQDPIETIDFVDQTCRHYPGEEAFSIGNALRYLARGPHKNNKIEDVRKAIWYLNHAATLMEAKEQAYFQARAPEPVSPTPLKKGRRK